ncbi:hypothetical protein BC629DRAFT_1210753 [Irpex lacteus]|nr:hypothetical protein BC629DRAFT_1210753 [Irpex lacteus]
MKKKVGASRGFPSGHASDPSLPTYTKNWPKGVYKPRNLPNGLDTRIAAAYIFALPGEDGTGTGPIYIVPQACARCSRDKQYCTRGEPCGRCEGTAYASTCKPRDEGWARLYLPSKTKPSDSAVVDSPVQGKPSLPRKPRQSRLPAQQSISTTIAGKSSRYNEPVIRKSARIRHELPSSVSSRDLRAAERAKKLRLSTRGPASGTNGNRKRNTSSATPSTVGNFGRSASRPRSTPSPPSSPEPVHPSSERISCSSAIEKDEEHVRLSADLPPSAPMPLLIASGGTAQTDHPPTTHSPLTSLRLTASANTQALFATIE